MITIRIGWINGTVTYKTFSCKKEYEEYAESLENNNKCLFYIEVE